ncbi:hypothetical protein FB45DRAFT_1034449 [Roridomyces roridus]|uniref:Uncharacterized protein n=1 Tax=Roridomyces roridus TaxID=1738132 RepID=A0AAD7BD79_9AGAR|nr:hypothetical protein FB45DRAFT_1034449 [Roridomyces roridus]
MLRPRLPLDVERETFEWAAIAQPSSIPTLLRVAQRVRSWVEPYLYRAIKVAPYPPYSLMARDVLTPLSRSKPARFYTDAVRHLYIQDQPRADVLRICTRTRSITSYGLAPELMTILPQMPDLRRLSLSLRELFDPNPPRMQPFLSRITHLDLHDIIGEDDDEDPIVRLLPLLPALTHLCLCDQVPPVRKILVECTRLEILVNLWLVSGADLGRGRRLAATPPVQDPRFVVSVYNDVNEEWGAEVRGHSVWDAADDFVARKRRGEIPDSRYWMDYWLTEEEAVGDASAEASPDPSEGSRA